MALPVQVQLFTALLGTNEGMGQVLLPEVFSTDGSYNMWVDKLGRIVRRKGYVSAGAAITMNGSGDAGIIRGMGFYRSQDGTKRHILAAADDGGDEWELSYSNNGGSTWTFLEDMGMSSIRAIPDYAQFADKLYITNGVMAPRKWDGTTLALAAQAVTNPLTSSLPFAAGAGTLVGEYQWKLVAKYSDGTRKLAGLASSILSVQYGLVDLSWVADTDTTVVGYEIYRTTGTGKFFYFLTYLDGRTTVAFRDNISDVTLLEGRVLQEHGEAPPTGARYVETHKGRVWWGGTSAYPTRVWWSDAGLPTSVYVENYLEFSDNSVVGDVVTGMIGGFQDNLVVFTERGVWTVAGTGALIGDVADWDRQRAPTVTGAVSGRTCVVVPAGARYTDENGEPAAVDKAAIAFWTPLGDIRLFDGEGAQVISTPVSATLRTVPYDLRSLIHSAHDAESGQIIWFYPSAASTSVDSAVVWNYKWGLWYYWRGLEFATSLVASEPNDAQVIYASGGQAGTGVVCRVFEGVLDNQGALTQTTISAAWMSKPLYGINPQGGGSVFSYSKRNRWVDLILSLPYPVSLKVEVFLQGALTTEDLAAPSVSQTFSGSETTLLTADGVEIRSVDGQAITLSSSLLQQKKILLKKSDGTHVHSEGIRLRITNQAQSTSDPVRNADWGIEGIGYAYQILTGLGRRNQ